jgi:hypothetical protein
VASVGSRTSWLPGVGAGSLVQLTAGALRALQPRVGLPPQAEGGCCRPGTGLPGLPSPTAPSCLPTPVHADVWRLRHGDEKQQVEPLHAIRQAARPPLLARRVARRLRREPWPTTCDSWQTACSGPWRSPIRNENLQQQPVGSVLNQSLSQPTPSSSASKPNGSGGLTEIGPSTYSGPFPEPPAQS